MATNCLFPWFRVTVNHTRYTSVLGLSEQQCLSANCWFMFSIKDLQMSACVLRREMRLTYSNISWILFGDFLKCSTMLHVFRIVVNCMSFLFTWFYASKCCMSTKVLNLFIMISTISTHKKYSFLHETVKNSFHPPPIWWFVFEL